jgi:hypothetical protein
MKKNMRQFLTGFLFIFCATTFGQATTQKDSLTFCSQNFKVPEGCTTGKNKIKCDDYDMSWTYVDELKFLKGMSDKERLRVKENSFIEFSNSFNLKNFKRKRITCYLLDTKVKGYKISYKTAKGMIYQIYASGIINGRAVSTLLTLEKDVSINDDIPEFPRQIIKLTE